MARARTDLWWMLLTLFGAGSLAHGSWMLADSLGWFQRIAPDVLPFNVHFVRDIGAAYVTAGAALLWAAFKVEWRGPLVAPAALFYALHALGHVRETAGGELAAHHWWADLPGVYGPAAVLVVMAVLLLRPTG